MVPTRRFHLALGAVVCLAALTASGPAASQVPGRSGAGAAATGTASATPADRADELYRKGIAAGAAKDWPHAFQFLWDAYQLKKSYDIEGNLGTAELRLGKFQAAAEHLAHSLTLFPVNGSPDAKAKTEGLLEEAKKEVGILRLTVTPPDALVKVGGRQLGPEDSRNQVFVEPGEMRVEAGGVENFEGTSQSVKVAKGQIVNVTLALTPLAKPTATTSGTATAGPAATGVPSADPLRTPLIVSGIAVTAATLGIGIGLLVASSGKLDEGKKQRDELLKDPTARAACNRPEPEPRCKLSALDEASTLGNVGVPMLVGGVAVGAATLLYVLVARPKTPPPIQAGVTVQSKGGGLFVGGNW